MRACALVHRKEDLALVPHAAAIGETLVVAAAPAGEPADRLFGAARALGAGRLVRVWDESLEATDYLGVAYTLAATVRAALGDLTEAGAVILCGDAGHGAVGPAVAERLGLPHLGGVIGLSVDGGRVVVRRREGAVAKLYAAAAPMVLCMRQAAPPPEQTATAEPEVWAIGRAGLTAAELLPRRRFRAQPAPGPEASPRRFDDAAALARRLRDDGLVPGGR